MLVYKYYFQKSSSEIFFHLQQFLSGMVSVFPKSDWLKLIKCDHVHPYMNTYYRTELILREPWVSFYNRRPKLLFSITFPFVPCEVTLHSLDFTFALSSQKLGERRTLWLRLQSKLLELHQASVISGTHQDGKTLEELTIPIPQATGTWQVHKRKMYLKL